jgi:hypothetical protein
MFLFVAGSEEEKTLSPDAYETFLKRLFAVNRGYGMEFRQSLGDGFFPVDHSASPHKCQRVFGVSGSSIHDTRQRLKKTETCFPFDRRAACGRKRAITGFSVVFLFFACFCDYSNGVTFAGSILFWKIFLFPHASTGIRKEGSYASSRERRLERRAQGGQRHVHSCERRD